MPALLNRGAFLAQGLAPARRCPCEHVAKAAHRAVRADVKARVLKDDSRSTKDEESVGLGLKAVWYAAESFGKVVALGTEPSTHEERSVPQTTAQAEGKPVITRAEAIAGIRDDYNKDYFISGAGAMVAYDPECEFSDPFVSFRGVKRFQTNVGNLGRLMRDVNLDVYEFRETGRCELVTRWRFSCLLDLPWRPRIAAAGNTTHILDPTTNLCVQHIERWEVEVGKVIRQLFRPAARVPENAWQTFILALSDGDLKGMWWVLSPTALRLGLPILLVDAVTRGFTGDGLPGALEAGILVVIVSAVATQVIKFSQGLKGGATGTGGRF